MEELFSPIKSIGVYIKKFKDVFRKYKLEKSGYRYSLVNVTSRNNEIELHVILVGIKKQFLKLRPEEIINDDELLSEFSPCDVRAITYLSFQKYIKQEHYSLVIEKQYLNKGETIFTVKDINTNELFKIYAKKLYQNYDLLIKFCKKDIVTVISSAVQEQTFLDIKNMEMS